MSDLVSSLEDDIVVAQGHELVQWPADNERRFGGLRRLYGDSAYECIRAAHVAVVGLGGVGSWAAEALARSGVAALTLIDLDHVSESNINRQVQALGSTLGKSKTEALRERIAEIHPDCRVQCVEEFVDAGNWPGLLSIGEADSSSAAAAAASASASASASHGVDVVIDACDQVKAKLVMAAWALSTGRALVVVGAAGGKRRPQAIDADDLARVTHDPLLASLRQQLRKRHGASRTSNIGLRCVFSKEAVVQPAVAGAGRRVDASQTPDISEPVDALQSDEATGNDGSLNCHGYGSTVTVTASFGMLAANEALEHVARGQSKQIKSMPEAGSSPVDAI